RVDFRAINRIQSKKEVDAPCGETGRLKLCASRIDRYRIITDRSPEHLGQAIADFRPRKRDRARQYVTLSALRWLGQNGYGRVNDVDGVNQCITALRCGSRPSVARADRWRG